MIRKGQKLSGSLLKGSLRSQLFRGFAAPQNQVTIFVDDKEYKVEEE
jgi:hypothetical protein